ncbi:hypothetical protein IGI04_010602 [Brassica rapa subsp. trilocularis]|uniref:Uncharacterized protein n=1 Tax=Brassica rapa subsp. trilocularis TaxID=1813537 RepID=A0ABQ7N0M0_BRACM|nr:hypothetical protein IGI04_010602 [Brassica rapa subsp. trilocularis]
MSRRELYVGQLQLLKKMFPGGDKDKFLSISNKIEDAMSQCKQDSPLPPKSITMQRSLSAGSPRFTSRGINLGPPDLRDEWFKVRTVDAGGAAAGGGVEFCLSREGFPVSLFCGLILLLSLPIVIIAYLFVSEALSIQILIYISFAGIKIRDIELVSRAVLPRFYAADVRKDSFEVFDKCKRKVVVTANPIVMVEPFVKDYLGGDKVLGTEIEVNPKTMKATGFVKKPGVLVGDLKRLAILKEFGEESPDLGLGDRTSDHDFMSICKVKIECINVCYFETFRNQRSAQVLKLAEYLETWEKDDKTKLILIKGAGRAFSAGGDLKMFYDGRDLKDSCLEVVYKMYWLCYHIHTYKKTQVSLVNGISMGGGASLMVPMKFSVVTEKTVFATPEASIGFHTDCGFSYIHSRLPGHLGEFLALTGARLNGKELVAIGMATYFVPSAKHLGINSLSYHSTEDEENEEDSNCKNSVFFGLFDDSESTRLRSGSMKRQYSDIGYLYHKLFKEQHDDDGGLRMDMRVLTVIEYMRELYVGQLQLLKKMFPGGTKDKFLGFFNKIGDAMSQFKQESRLSPTKSMTMQRSLSAGSPRFTSRGINLGPPDLRDEWFKVRTVDAGGGGADGGGKSGSAAGQGQTKK